mmetsp:Transcript_24235/g.61656  ORF Transcript_24235/g.61656 Transcript_24235/m.61656 type:complete len:227 (+) Transcript_24235:76-756(+)
MPRACDTQDIFLRSDRSSRDDSGDYGGMRGWESSWGGGKWNNSWGNDSWGKDDWESKGWGSKSWNNWKDSGSSSGSKAKSWGKWSDQEWKDWEAQKWSKRGTARERSRSRGKKGGGKGGRKGKGKGERADVDVDAMDKEIAEYFGREVPKAKAKTNDMDTELEVYMKEDGKSQAKKEAEKPLNVSDDEKDEMEVTVVKTGDEPAAADAAAAAAAAAPEAAAPTSIG